MQAAMGKSKEKTAKQRKPAENGRRKTDLEQLRVSAGRGTLAEDVLESLEAMKADLARIQVDVAAVGSSLRVAREQLAEQQQELNALLAKSARAPRPA
jgi:hypothetical protein